MSTENNKYIDISLTHRNQFIYRIIPVERLFQLFEKKKNVLAKPKEWEDPFENFILHSKVKLPSGKLVTFGSRDHFYGQCWTLHTASDAMWRIYSPDVNAVRIRTTVNSLLVSLADTCGAGTHEEAFIGKVQYLPNSRLIAYAKNLFSKGENPSPRILAQTLLIKRPAFKHEREVRLLFLPHDGTIAKDDFYFYDINPHTLISQIMIDPRLTVKEANDLRNKIKKETGYRGSIKRSLLYSAPPELILQFGRSFDDVFNINTDRQRIG